MSIIMGVLQNLLMGLRPLARLAQRFHSTGLNADPEMVGRVLNLYSRYASLSGKDILEIGPGQTLEVLERAMAAGARSCTAIDVLHYLSREQARRKQINYVVYDGREMPLATESLDLICSYTALEHVRYPSMTVQECFRILRPGGKLVSVIDLGDHSWYGKNTPYPDRVFDCLRYPEWLWNLMRWNRSSYVNRLRRSDWIRLFTEAGFVMHAHEATVSDHTVYLLSQLAYLHQYQYDDAVTCVLTVCMEKPALLETSTGG
ncbi:MAG: class I SAM-dependent methyltransferase [Nitrospira sp.]|nr:class I SAM-dependent methyltransferase [Nitrospira sp.]